MKTEHPPPLEELRARFGDQDDGPVPAVSLASALVTGTDPGNILAYLNTLGHRVRSLEELHQTICDLEGEDDVDAHEVAEGVAVSIASDGLWFLFRP